MPHRRLLVPGCSLLCCCAIALMAAGCGDNLSGDPGGPAVEIVSPAPGAVLGDPAVAVRIRVRAPRGLASLAIEDGASAVAVTLAQDALDASGEATVTLELDDGAHELHLIAIDAAGASAYDAAEIRVDGVGPSIDVGAPRADAAETRRLLFAQLADEAGIAAISYAVNGGAAIAIPVTGAPERLVIHEALPLIAGPNTVTLTVTDGFGHERRETIAFRYGTTTSGGGAHSGAIVGGELRTWGRYNVGQLGLGGVIGDAQSRLAPETVPAFGAAGTTVAAIAFNQNSSLALRSDGTVWTWGANGDGQLGHGDTTQRSVPAQIAGLPGVVYAHLGYSHALALRADGAVLAWGKNAVGQAGVEGNGTPTDDQLVPVVVAGIPAPVVEVAAGSEHSLALTVDGRVYAWGRNQYGNLGAGTTDDARHPVPTAVPGLDDVIDIATGRDHVLALRADGSVASWGLGASGQLGYGTNSDPSGEDRASPVTVTADAAGAPLRGVRAVFANGNTSYAIIGAGAGARYWGWGQNFNGQLAVGATSSAEWLPRRAVMYTPGEAPVFLDQRAALSSIGVGVTHTIAGTASGAVYAWGWNFRGSLGVPEIANAWAQIVAVEVAVP